MRPGMFSGVRVLFLVVAPFCSCQLSLAPRRHSSACPPPRRKRKTVEVLFVFFAVAPGCFTAILVVGAGMASREPYVS